MKIAQFKAWPILLFIPQRKQYIATEFVEPGLWKYLLAILWELPGSQAMIHRQR